MSSLFTAQAKRRAEELGVSERVHFIHNDAAGYVANEKCDVAACGVSSTSDFLTLPGLVGAFDDLGYDVVEMVLADQEGWDRYEAAKWLTMRRWLEANPDDDFAAEVRAELNIAPKRYVTYARECFGWGVFALIAR